VIFDLFSRGSEKVSGLLPGKGLHERGCRLLLALWEIGVACSREVDSVFQMIIIRLILVSRSQRFRSEFSGKQSRISRCHFGLDMIDRGSLARIGLRRS
jgi:hypothetical protein